MDIHHTSSGADPTTIQIQPGMMFGINPSQIYKNEIEERQFSSKTWDAYSKEDWEAESRINHAQEQWEYSGYNLEHK